MTSMPDIRKWVRHRNLYKFAWVCASLFGHLPGAQLYEYLINFLSIECPCSLCSLHRAPGPVNDHSCHEMKIDLQISQNKELALQGPFLAGYTDVDSAPFSYGLQRLDHAVGNVHDMQETLDYISKATGFHQFAEFTAEVWPVGTSIVWTLPYSEMLPWAYACQGPGDLALPRYVQCYTMMLWCRHAKLVCTCMATEI